MSFSHPNNTRIRQTIGIVGGPLASLLFGFGVFLYLRNLPATKLDSQWQVTALLIMSVWLFLSSVIPYTHKNLQNDAALIIGFWKDGDKWANYYADLKRIRAENARYEALKTLAAAMRNSQPPHEWNRNVVEQATILCDGKCNEAIGAHYGFYWAADRGNWAMAENYINRALTLQETLPHTWRVMVLLDGAYYSGLIQNNALTAYLLLTKASEIIADDEDIQAMIYSMTLRAEAAALLAEGKLEKASQKAQVALTSLIAVASGDYADRCLIEKLIAACSASIPHTTI